MKNKIDPNVTVKIRRNLKPLVSMRAAQMGESEVNYISRVLIDEMKKAGVFNTFQQMIQERKNQEQVQ